MKKAGKKEKRMRKAGKMVGLGLSAVLLIAGGGFGYLYFNGLSGLSQGGSPGEGQIRVACVGDSVTYGHGVQNWPQNNYPAVLSELLGDAYHVGNFGVSGRAVQPDSDQPYPDCGRYEESLAYDCDILVFMMGSNDSKPENWHGGADFGAQLRRLLDSYTAQNKELRFYLCTPPTAFFTEKQTNGQTNFDIQPAIVEEIAQIVREVSKEYDCTLIDVHTLTQAHPEWFEKDGVHPDKAGARAIAQTVAEAILSETAEETGNLL